MADKIVHKIHLDRYAPMPAQIQLGTVESYGVEQIAVVAGAGWDGLDDIVAVYHPPKAAEPVRVLVPSDGLSDVPPEATASAGRGALVIAGMADGVQIASCNIAYTVIAQAGTDGTTSDAPTPDLVQQILSAANGAVKTADGVRADMDKVLEAESGRETAEADRAAAESARVEAETARVDAEAYRAAAEKERQTAESVRIAAEDDRQSAETSRAKAETARESAETDRVEAEAARVNAEEEREKQLPALKSSVDELRARQNILAGSETGNPVVVDDAFASPLCGLTVYGKSTQDGTPSPDAPVPIVSAGDGGTVVVTLGDGGAKTKTITLSTPGGLPGIPVTSGGNYTDPSGQKWICDEVDLERGVKVQRVYKVDVDGENVKFEQSGDYANLMPKGLPIALYAKGQRTYAISTFTNLSWFFNMRNGQFLYLIAADISGRFNESCKKQLGKVYYALATPIETPLTSAEIAAYKALTAYGPDTVVQVSDGAGVKLDYQRDLNLVVKNLEDAIASMTTT